MKTISREIVSALIFSKDGKIFQGMKDPKNGGVYSDCWHLPGGGIDEGEEKIVALVREVKEETGLDISSSKPELIDSTGTGESEKILNDTNEKVICKMNFYVYKITLDKDSDEIEITLDDDLVNIDGLT